MDTTTRTIAPRELLSAGQVGALIGRTPERVGQLAREGRLRSIAEVYGADGRCWRMFAPAEVGRYLREREDQAR